MGSSQSQQRPGTSSWFSSTPQGSGIYGQPISNNYVQPSSSWFGSGGRKRKSKVNKKTNHKTKRRRR
jgi:hypothetical protein